MRLTKNIEQLLIPVNIQTIVLTIKLLILVYHGKGASYVYLTFTYNTAQFGKVKCEKRTIATFHVGLACHSDFNERKTATLAPI